MHDGELIESDGRWELRFVRELAHPVEKVWRAITEPAGLAAWFPFDIEGERAAGAPLRFVFRDDEGPPFSGSMVEFQPLSVMELRWEGDETLRLEVAPSGSGCVLTLANRFDQLDQARPRRRRLAHLPRPPRLPPGRRATGVREQRALAGGPPGLRLPLRSRGRHHRPADLTGARDDRSWCPDR